MSIQGTEDIAKEVTKVLEYADDNIISKIPEKFLNLLNKIAEKSDKEIEIDVNKELTEQNISEESKDLIALIYYSYIANDEEKKQLAKKWNENKNEKKKKIELEEKKTINEVFNNTYTANQESNQLIEQTKVTKLKQKIFNFFGKIFKKY